MSYKKLILAHHQLRGDWGKKKSPYVSPYKSPFKITFKEKKNDSTQARK